MFAKTVTFALLFACVYSRTIITNVDEPNLDIDELKRIWTQSSDEELGERIFDSLYPELSHNLRYRRDVRGAMSTNPDGSANLNVKIPIGDYNPGDANRLSAVAGVAGQKTDGSYGAVSGGLALENVNGHAITLTEKHIPAFGDQLTAAAKVNLLHTDNHDLNANAFITKNMPKFPNVPDFNKKGGSIDYTFNDKVGASLGMSQTDLLKRTDYSAMGNLNLFRDRDSSLDFNAGYTKAISPYIPDRSWQPTAGISWTKFW